MSYRKFPRARGRKRKRAGEMNALEKAYSELLEERKQRGEIVYWAYESAKFRMADKTWLTPDFLVMLADGSLEIHETKGFMFDDAAVKLKVVAETIPIPIFLCTRKKKTDPWKIVEV